MNDQKAGKVMNLDAVFSPQETSSLNERQLYLATYGHIPNIISESDINCGAARLWFMDTYRSDIRDQYYNKYQWGKNEDLEIDDHFFFLYEDLLVHFDTRQKKVRFLFKFTREHVVQAILTQIQKYPVGTEYGSQIGLLVNSRWGGIDIEQFDIAKPNLNIKDNYNEDFMSVHKLILGRLRAPKDKGLVLLHGKPGTGKTSYIRYLVHEVKKRVIFLPPSMASVMTEPTLISVLIQQPDSILVIEDAENIITDREKNGRSPVSVLLNLTDGLLADCLNIQVICSFNTDISKVDSALLRKGRLIANYEFKPLEVAKAQALSTKLGFSTCIEKPTSLTSIYNQDERDYGEVRSRVEVGFRAMNHS